MPRNWSQVAGGHKLRQEVHGVCWWAYRHRHGPHHHRKGEDNDVPWLTPGKHLYWQPGIDTINRVPDAQSGQYLLACIVRLIDYLRKIDGGLQITLHWIPAHKGVPGNEAADVAAKEATGWREPKKRKAGSLALDFNGRDYSARAEGPKAEKPKYIRFLMSSLKQSFRHLVAKEWTLAWIEAKHERATRRLLPNPTRTVLSRCKGMTRAISSIIVQLRIGRSPWPNTYTTLEELSCPTAAATTTTKPYPTCSWNGPDGSNFGKKSGVSRNLRTSPRFSVSRSWPGKQPYLWSTRASWGNSQQSLYSRWRTLRIGT